MRLNFLLTSKCFLCQSIKNDKLVWPVTNKWKRRRDFCASSSLNPNPSPAGLIRDIGKAGRRFCVCRLSLCHGTRQIRTLRQWAERFGFVVLFTVLHPHSLADEPPEKREMWAKPHPKQKTTHEFINNWFQSIFIPWKP